MNMIPQPANLQALQDWRRDVDRAITDTGTRTLESASITKGTLHVRNGGGITIGDGGTLRLLKGGNLILGKGKIAGAALKEQFKPEPIRAPAQTQKIAVSKAWTTVRALTLTAPPWATTATITASFAAGTAGDTYDATAQLLVNKKLLWKAGTTGIYLIDDPWIQSQATGAGAVEIPLKDNEREIRLELQWAMTNTSGQRQIQTEIAGLALWARTS